MEEQRGGGRGSERANARVREGLAWGVLYVAGSIQPRALDSKLPLSAVFPLFSHSPQPSPRCYLPIVPPSFSYSRHPPPLPPPRFQPPPRRPAAFPAVHPPAVLPLGPDTTSPTTTTRVLLLSAPPVPHKCRKGGPQRLAEFRG